MKQITNLFFFLTIIALTSCDLVEATRRTAEKRKAREIILDSYITLTKKVKYLNISAEDYYILPLISDSIIGHYSLDNEGEYKTARFIFIYNNHVYRYFYILDWNADTVVDLSAEGEDFFLPNGRMIFKNDTDSMDLSGQQIFNNLSQFIHQIKHTPLLY